MIAEARKQNFCGLFWGGKGMKLKRNEKSFFCAESDKKF